MELCSGCPSYWCRMRGGCPKYKGLRRSQLKPVLTGLQRITMVAVFSDVSSLRAGDGGQLPRNNQFLPWQGSLKHNCPLSLSETDFASNTAPCPSASLPPNEGERITALHVEKKNHKEKKKSPWAPNAPTTELTPRQASLASDSNCQRIHCLSSSSNHPGKPHADARLFICLS